VKFIVNDKKDNHMIKKKSIQQCGPIGYQPQYAGNNVPYDVIQ